MNGVVCGLLTGVALRLLRIEMAIAREPPGRRPPWIPVHEKAPSKGFPSGPILKTGPRTGIGLHSQMAAFMVTSGLLQPSEIGNHFGSSILGLKTEARAFLRMENGWHIPRM